MQCDPFWMKWLNATIVITVHVTEGAKNQLIKKRQEYHFFGRENENGSSRSSDCNSDDFPVKMRFKDPFGGNPAFTVLS